jgi:hypothetical protein
MYMAHTSDDIYSPVTIYYYDLYGQNLEQILIRIPFYSDFYYHISIASAAGTQSPKKAKNFPASKSSPFQKFWPPQQPWKMLKNTHISPRNWLI